MSVISISEPTVGDRGNFKLGIAWVLLCLALAAHVTDEATTGFPAVYNPTVTALRARLGYWPMPTFEFRDWSTGLIVAVVVVLALSPFVFHGRFLFLPLLLAASVYALIQLRRARSS